MDLGSVLSLGLLAVFLAVQPWSVLAAILLVTTRDGTKKEIAYVGGWVTVLLALAIGTVLVYPNIPDNSTASQSRAAVELAIGVVLGAWLARRWRHPKDAGSEKQPTWMGKLDTMSPLLAFGLGAFLPSYAVVVAAISEMLSSGLSQGSLLVAALAWVALASAGVASPLWVRIRDPEHAEDTYARWRDWVVGHSRMVLYSVGGLVAVVLTVKGIVGLVS